MTEGIVKLQKALYRCAVRRLEICVSEFGVAVWNCAAHMSLSENQGQHERNSKHCKHQDIPSQSGHFYKAGVE